MVRIRIVVSLMLLFLQFSAFGQIWPGYETGRFGGISNANTRPGGMAPMPYKVDINLFAAHLNGAPGDLFSSDFPDALLSGGFYKLKGFSQLKSDRMHMFSNLQGPSFQVQATPKLAFAFSWNVRHMWLSDLSDPGVSQLFDKELPNLNISGTGATANILYTGWSEYGIGAGGMVYDESYHSLSVGGFAKLVFGTGLMNLNVDQLNYSVNNDVVESVSFSLDAELSENFSRLVDDGGPNFAEQLGYGFDLGAEYRFLNPRACPGGANYRAIAGISITDIGKMKFASVSEYTADQASAGDFTLNRLRTSTLASAVDTMQQLLGVNSAPGVTSITLPMSVRLYGGFNFKRRVAIYGELHTMFAQFVNPEMPAFVRFNVTPRFEDDRYGIYLPLTFTNYTPANVGLAIRLKPIIIGSGNLFSSWAYEDRGQALDMYIAIKIPILNDDERIDWKRMMR